MAFLAVSSFLMMGEIGIQSAEAGNGPGCNHKDGEAAIVDSKASNSVNTNIQPTTPQPIV